MAIPRGLSASAAALAIAGAAAFAPAAHATPAAPALSAQIFSALNPDRCAGDPASIHQAIQEIDPPLADSKRWVFTGETNYDLCRDLSYALLDTEGGTASSPKQVLLFHRGEFVGTTENPYPGYHRILDSGDNFVTVQNGSPGSANAEVLWGKARTFRWVDDKVVVEEELGADPQPQ